MRYLIGLDIGGTSIKSAIIDIDDPTNGVCGESFSVEKINSYTASRNEVIEGLAHLVQLALEKAIREEQRVMGIGVATPGPFDYRTGTSYMTHKYKAIYGLSLRQLFRKFFQKPGGYPVFFQDDCRAFLLGEAIYGVAREQGRRIGITIGTGLGAAFMDENGVLLESQNVPFGGRIWALPHESGIVDDIVSRRGIEGLYRKHSNSTNDVKRIAQLAFLEDKVAKQVFEEMGGILGRILRPIVEEFMAECVVFGGGISRSFSLFATDLVRELADLPCFVTAVQAAAIDLSVFYGLTYQYGNGQFYG